MADIMLTALPYVRNFDGEQYVQFFEHGSYVGEIKVKDIHYVEESVVERFLREWEEKLDGVR